MRLSRLLRKAAAAAAAACMTLGGFSQVVLADYAVQGDVLAGWVCQVVAQNGAGAQNANLWMNDGVCDAISYQTDQHIVLDPADGAFANAEDDLSFAAIYFSYYGEFSGEAQFDATLSNVTIYSTGYDPIVIADYSTVDAGTNVPVSETAYAIRYDFQDQLDISIRTGVLRNLERIEFDLYIDSVNFSDAPQVEGEAASQDTYGELAVAGQDAGIDVIFFAMDSGWSWLQTTNGVRLNYQTDDHVVLPVDGATVFASAVAPMNLAGFMIGYYNDSLPEDTLYKIDYTFSNIVFTFDAYDPVVIESLTSEQAEHDAGVTHAGRLYTLGYFPEGADTAEMLRHLTSIEFDYRVDFLGAAGVEGVGNTPEETTEEETTTEEDTETEEQTEEATEEETEKETEKETETSASAEEAAAEVNDTSAEETEEGSGNNDTVKIVVTVVAVVILVGALIAVGVMYIKKSKQI